MTARSRWRRDVAAALVAMAVVAGTIPGGGRSGLAADAKKKDVHAEAVEHFEKGKKLGEVGRYEESIREFEEAYLLEPLPDILLNIALNHRYLKHYDKAIELYERYLRLKPDALNRKEIEKLLKELARERDAAKAPPVGPGTGDVKPPAPTKGKVSLSSDPPGARVSEGGDALGTTPSSVELFPGSHILRFEHAGYQAKDVGVFVEAGRDTSVAVVLTPMGDARPIGDTGLGRLTITTNLPGAELRLDGVEFGYLPIAERTVPAGAHRLAILAPGFTDRFVDVLVGRESTTELNVELMPAHPRSLDIFEANYDKFLTSGLTIEGYRRLRMGRGHVYWGIGTVAVSTVLGFVLGLAASAGGASESTVGRGVGIGLLLWLPGAGIGSLYIYGGRKKIAHAKTELWTRPAMPESAPRPSDGEAAGR